MTHPARGAGAARRARGESGVERVSGADAHDGREATASVEKPTAPVESSREFQEALRDAKLDALKELAYGASHEINNPLANIALRAQTLLKREDDDDKRRALEAMHRAAMRAHEMISDLMLFARPPAPTLRSENVGKIVERVAQAREPRAQQQGARLRFEDLSESARCCCDAQQIEVAVGALVDNSLEAVGEGGLISLSVDRAGKRWWSPWRTTAPACPLRSCRTCSTPSLADAKRGVGSALACPSAGGS